MWSHSADPRGPGTVRRRPLPSAVTFWFWIAVSAVVPAALAAWASGFPMPPIAAPLDQHQVPSQYLHLPNLVQLNMNPRELADLVENPLAKGRRWERVGHVAFYADGVKQFESPVGVRIHGGISRTLGNVRSFRLHFRETLHGTDAPGPLVGLTTLRLHKELVLHGDVRGREVLGLWHYVNPLIYDIAREMKIPTAETVPSTLIINDGPPLPYVVSEHLDKDYLESRLGKGKYAFFDTKDPEAQEALAYEGPIAELTRRFGRPDTWTHEQIGQVVDLDNLSRWFILALLCGSKDMWQGPLVHEQTRPDSKWFWVAWDFDQSFGRPDPYDPLPVPSWEYDQFAQILSPAGLKSNADARMVLLRRLFQSSAEFRESFARLFVDIRDNTLTPDFLDRTITKYERVASISGIKETGYQAKIREYVAHRPIVVQRQLIQYLHTNIP